MEMKMFEVCAKCGHVGRGYYVEKIFAVKAESGKDAAAKVRNTPRVKHHHTDAIRYVEQIGPERFREILEINDADPYFKCKNVQEQREMCKLEVMPENTIDLFVPAASTNNSKPVYYRKQQIRNPRRYVNNYLTEVRYAM